MNNYKEHFINNEFNKYCKKYTYTPFILPPVEKIIVFGDIHGDYKLAVNLLIISGVAEITKTSNDPNNKVDTNDIKDDTSEIQSSKIYKMRWIGGKTHVVQVGDQVDRCRVYGNLECSNPKTTLDDEDADVKIMELFTDLHEQAVKDGGAVISLLGNHEINNAMGIMTYVSAKGLDGFKDYKDPKDSNIVFNSGYDARVHAFKPGNEYAMFMGCTRVPAIIIGSNLFAHAGIVNELIRMKDEKTEMSRNIKREKKDKKRKERKSKRNEMKYQKAILEGGNPTDTENTQNTNININDESFRLNYDTKYLNKEVFYFKEPTDFENVNIVIKRWLMGIVKENNVYDLISARHHEKSMFWNRILGMLNQGLSYDEDVCVNNIDKVLKLFKVNNIIIGHTPQSMQHGLFINATCGDKVWRVDTASSSAFDRFDQTFVATGKKLESRKFQYLLIKNDKEYYVCFEDGCKSVK
jgi:hypothetical protein